MIDVAQRFYARFPRLAGGRARSASQPVVELLRRVTAEAELNALLGRLGEARGFDFVGEALRQLGVRYTMAPTDLAHLPSEGRCVVVANHPLGAVDALALLHLVGQVRRDVRILANDVLMQLEPLRALLLPCEVFAGAGAGAARGGLREAFRALEREEMLLVFPAGEVSRFRPGGVRDGRWSPGFLRFARRAGAPVVPVHIGARNSAAFYGASMLAKPLATLMLPREMLDAGRPLTFTIGAPVAPAALALPGRGEAQVAQRMRAHVYRLARRQPPVFATSAAIAHPEPPGAVRRALAAGEVLGQTREGKRIVLLDAGPSDPALREIGRLRELAFRRVGEGTGLARDLDRHDPHYRHLVLWDDQALEIVGAYRLGDAARLLPAQGVAGLYSASLFDFAPGAEAWLGQAVELGRSFVHPRHWGSRSLDMLWQGIGAFLRARPDARYAFGPVSLSADLPERARGWIVEVHRQVFGDPELLATARNPWRAPPALADEVRAAIAGLSAAEALQRLKRELGAEGVALPTLYKQYVDLVEPDGVRFLAFGVDPAFGHCIDGLVRLDLTRLKPAKRARYLGAPEGPANPAA